MWTSFCPSYFSPQVPVLDTLHRGAGGQIVRVAESRIFTLIGFIARFKKNPFLKIQNYRHTEIIKRIQASLGQWEVGQMSRHRRFGADTSNTVYCKILLKIAFQKSKLSPHRKYETSLGFSVGRTNHHGFSLLLLILPTHTVFLVGWVSPLVGSFVLERLLLGGHR